MTARTPGSAAAGATACAWLPDEKATAPRARSSSESERILFVAPRILNAPARWKFSHLKKTRRPAAASNVREVATGVRCTNGRTRASANWMKSSVNIRRTVTSDERQVTSRKLLATSSQLLALQLVTRHSSLLSL